MNCTKCGKEFDITKSNLVELAATLKGINPNDVDMKIEIKCKDCLEEEEKDGDINSGE